MSDGGTGEKTEEPTPEKLRKLREEGQVPKSQDVTSAVSFICTFAVLAATAGYMGDEMISLVETALSNINSGESGEVLAHRLDGRGYLDHGKGVCPRSRDGLCTGTRDEYRAGRLYDHNKAHYPRSK